MDKTLSGLETRLQRLIEEGTARLFSSKDMKSALSARLAECMHAEVHKDEKGDLVAPHVYTIEVNSQHAAELKSNPTFISELESALSSAATKAGVRLLSEPVLHIAPSDDVPEGDFKVRSAGLGVSLSNTQSLKLPEQDPQSRIPQGAFLIVNGSNIFPLSKSVINIGRKRDNQLVIDDPHVSRHHAQLRAISGNYHFFDLGSSGGSTINGKKTRSAALLGGDVISLAGVPLIYGQDSSAEQEETQEIHSAQASSQQGTTADQKSSS